VIFLTYNDSFSGIYKSQVIDVCTFLEKEFNCSVKLISLVSLRNYSSQKKLIKSAYPQAKVYPMFPKIQFWKMNTFLLFLICLFSGEKKIWARGPFACNIALALKKTGLLKKVVFDARGAYLAELTEYNVAGNTNLKDSISDLEKRALEESDAQLAVSKKLTEWWKQQHNFQSESSVIIPCTLSSSYVTEFSTESEIKKFRADLGFSENDTVLAYSGSSAEWQSFKMVDDFLFDAFSKHPSLKLIFLSDKIPADSKTFKQFSDRITAKWVKPAEVKNILLAADYGLLIRENSITNQVASPVKFAEYLACGLQVIISENIGDFSSFVSKNNCGALTNKPVDFKQVSYSQKQATHKLALTHLSKESEQLKKNYSLLLKD